MWTTRDEQVVESNFCGSTKRYFDRIHEKYGGVDIYCVCLLKQAKEGPENQLFTCYGEAIEIMQRNMGMEFVHYVPFDIYHFFKMEGDAKKATIQNLLDVLSEIALQAGFNHRESRQKAIVRINCADSLDRTNMVSFFYAMLIVAEWCRRTGLTDVVSPTPFSSDAPEKAIPQKLLNFLAKSFVRGGNIISIMYTNTEAQRAEMIWEYAQEKESGSSNLAISLQRRYNNLVTDPERQQTILLWTKNYHAFLPRFLVDHRLIHVLTRDFDASLLEIREEPKPTLCTSKDIELILPAGNYVTALWLYQFPSDHNKSLLRIKVWDESEIMVPNVDKPMWARYALPPNMKRKVRLEFDSTQFIIGKIALECTNRGFSLPVKREDIEINESIYSQLAKDIIASGKEKGVYFDVLSDLELIRINNCLTLTRAAQIVASLGINPWYLSPTRYLLMSSACPICRKDFCAADEQDFVIPGPKFYLSSFYPTRVTDMKPLHFPMRVKICDECIPKASEISQQTKVLESRVTLAPEVAPFRSFVDVNFDVEAANIAIYPYAEVIHVPAHSNGDPNKILTEEGGELELNSGDVALALPCVCEIYRLEFESDREFNVEMNQESLPGGLGENALTFALPESRMGVLRFHISTSAPVRIRRLCVFGKPVANTQMCPTNYMHKYTEPELDRSSKASFKWDSEHRVQIFHVRAKSPQLVHVTIRCPESGCPCHLVFSFGGMGKCTQHQVRLPQIHGKGRLSYLFATGPFDRLVVMYCDMVREVVPLKMEVKKYKHIAGNETNKAALSAVKFTGRLPFDMS